MTADDDSLRQRGPLCILGATGSVGLATVDVAKHLGMPIHSVSAGSQVDRLAALASSCGASVAHIADETLLGALQDTLSGTGIEARAGNQALCELAAEEQTPTVMAAIVGAAGLAPIMAAVDAGKRVCIANKEPLVMAGSLVMKRAAAAGAEILPVDSEHAALFQCLHRHHIDEVTKLIITGSGGPLRDHPDLNAVTVKEALAHPTWQMGPKITIDSATLMNKALEIVEAHHLFGISCDCIEVMIHPQSLIHGMVSFRDGSLIAQLSEPDMRGPIQQSLTWPIHHDSQLQIPDLTTMGRLDFAEPDRQRFPSIDLGYSAADRGNLACTVLNAANECAVARFLSGSIPFHEIFTTLERALASAPAGDADDLDTILACDRDTRNRLQMESQA